MRKNFRNIALIGLIYGSSLCSVLFAQGGLDEQGSKGIIYRSETVFDFRLHTNGMAFAVNLGEIITYYRTKYYHFEFGIMGDPREQNQNRNLLLGGRLSSSFAYGKQNSMMVLRAGVGNKYYLSEQAKRKGVSVGYNYQIGPSLALLKPYYLDLIYQENREGIPFFILKSERYTAENAERFTNFNSIFGSSGFGKGFGEINVIPGIQAKAALFFSMGAFDKYVRAIETGVMMDVFMRKVPIMIETENISNKPYFFNFYANLQFGYRKN